MPFSNTFQHQAKIFFRTKKTFLSAIFFFFFFFFLNVMPNSHKMRHPRHTQIGTFFLWCCLRAVWTLPLTTTGPICLRCVARRDPRPVWIRPQTCFDADKHPCFFVCRAAKKKKKKKKTERFQTRQSEHFWMINTGFGFCFVFETPLIFLVTFRWSPVTNLFAFEKLIS